MTYSTRGTMCGTFLLLALLAGCTRSGVLDTAPNQPPYVSAELLAPDLQVRTGKRAVSYDLTAYFDDTDGDPLEFDASSSDTAVASATVTEGRAKGRGCRTWTSHHHGHGDGPRRRFGDAGIRGLGHRPQPTAVRQCGTSSAGPASSGRESAR